MLSGENRDVRDVGASPEASAGTHEETRLIGRDWEEAIHQKVMKIRGSFGG